MTDRQMNTQMDKFIERQRFRYQDRLIDEEIYREKADGLIDRQKYSQ